MQSEPEQSSTVEHALRLSGKNVIVTGAASGIGRAACARFSAEGASIIAVDLDARGLSETAEVLVGPITPITGGVGDVATWDRAIAAAERAGGLNAAYLNAGRYGFTGPIDEHPLDDYHALIEANITGVVLGVRACVPALRVQGGGVIVATASVAGIVAFEGNPMYTLTKQAVAGYVRAVAPSLLAQGIRINAVCPGVVDTPMTVGALGGIDPASAGIPLITPERIAEVALDLLTTDATGVCRAVRQDGEPVDWQFPSWVDLARA